MDQTTAVHSIHAQLTLCEYASLNLDGTFTILRGGIEHWICAGLPSTLVLWLFVEVPASSLASGQHALTIAVTSPEHTRVVTVDANVRIDAPDKPSKFALPIAASIEQYGNHKVECTVAGVRGAVSLLIMPIPAENKG